MIATFSIITSEIPALLTKRYFLDGDKLMKESGGQMVLGVAEVVGVKDVGDFAGVLKSLKNNQALCYGIPSGKKIGDKVKIVREEDKKPGDFSRTTKDFAWPTGAGVFFLDHDSGMDKQEFIDAVCFVMPELKAADKVWVPSSSSHVCHGDKDLTGLKGQRLYFLVDDASKIAEIGQVLYRKLWLAGMGHIQISAAGSLLDRSVIDSTVWQTNRLDFASGAKCEAPLQQKFRQPEIMPGCRKFFEAAKIQRISGSEEYQFRQMIANEKASLRSESEKQQAAHIEKRLEKVPESKRAEMRKFYKAAYNGGDLSGDFEITLFKDGCRVTKTVVEILKNKKDFDKCKTLDPIEPEYNNEHKTGILFLDGPVPTLYSMAHGEKKYLLKEKIEKNENEEIFREMQQDIKNQMEGKLSTIPLPWPRLSSGTNALREGTVTIICGATKVGKSFFSMNVVRHLHENAVEWAYLPLEDGKKEWTWRIMAILENDFTMVEDNPATALRRAEVMKRREPEIRAYLENVTQNPRVQPVIVNGKRTRQMVTPELILKWTEEQAKKGKRVIFVDPLAQISFGGFKKWEAEEMFVQNFCGIAADYKVSLVLVSHTKKGNDDEALTVEDMQGSAAFGRLCQTSILIGATSEMVETDIKRPEGIEQALSNRVVMIGAARNGAGTRSKLAYVVEPGSPNFKEIGYIAMKKNKGAKR